MIIQPTVARMVWMFRRDHTGSVHGPYAAVITAVHSMDSIRAAVLPDYGDIQPSQEFPLYQEGFTDHREDWQTWCEWTSFDLALAAKVVATLPTGGHLGRHPLSPSRGQALMGNHPKP